MVFTEGVVIMLSQRPTPPFQATPVPFADHTSMLRWGGQGGERERFDATDVSVGTMPENSTWRRAPITRGPWGWSNGGRIVLGWY